jgi:hypothetical protein
MHAILELLTNVGWWNFVMGAGLLSFLPPRWLARLLPWLPRPDALEPAAARH